MNRFYASGEIIDKVMRELKLHHNIHPGATFDGSAEFNLRKQVTYRDEVGIDRDVTMMETARENFTRTISSIRMQSTNYDRMSIGFGTRRTSRQVSPSMWITVGWNSRSSNIENR